jgi:hypothetical protein
MGVDDKMWLATVVLACGDGTPSATSFSSIPDPSSEPASTSSPWSSSVPKSCRVTPLLCRNSLSATSLSNLPTKSGIDFGRYWLLWLLLYEYQINNRINGTIMLD